MLMKKIFQSNLIVILVLTQPFFLLHLIYVISKHNSILGWGIGLLIYLFVSVVSILMCKKVIIDNGELTVFSFLGLKTTTISIKNIKSLSTTCKGPKAYCFSIWTDDKNIVIYPFFTKHYEELVNTVDELIKTEEIDLTEQIAKAKVEKENKIKEFDQKIVDLEAEKENLKIKVNKTTRRLITSQGEELVSEVEETLKAFNFIVTKMDELIPEGQPKLEDLRISDDNFEGIAEVKGYSKSGGKTSDFQKLTGRFSRFYHGEKGKFPDKLFYIVNGQIELPPSKRDIPLPTSKDDIKIFAEEGGVVISTLDLFQAKKLLSEYKPEEIRKSIMEAKGRWSVKDLKKLKKENGN